MCSSVLRIDGNKGLIHNISPRLLTLVVLEKVALLSSPLTQVTEAGDGVEFSTQLSHQDRRWRYYIIRYMLACLPK